MQKIIRRYNLTDWKEIVGWFGMLLTMFTYVLISLNIVDSNNVWYFVGNTVGSAGLALISYVKKTYQPAVMNVIFVIIGIIGIIRIIF